MCVVRGSAEKAEMESCVVCLSQPREALSISCGHKVMCLDCATKVKMINSSCPFCRVSMREVVLAKQHSAGGGGADGGGGGGAAEAPEALVGDDGGCCL